eukprot:TRINITY_DN3162_c0_g1_i7.p1 TRINITY_DN3162_c0_g1~~TRINITY_DN3162_c0_g1_i7.p1  ORF type:complete len:311 (+),score=74.72 TRINITY_DN3162_c0_g1_i7:470-1402(+)
MMQRINEELHKKEVNKLKEENKELMQVISDLKLENYELKEKLAILQSKQKNYIEEPLELLFEERVEDTPETDCGLSSKGTRLIYSPTNLRRESPKPSKSQIYIEEFSNEGFGGELHVPIESARPSKKIFPETCSARNTRDGIYSTQGAKFFPEGAAERRRKEAGDVAAGLDSVERVQGVSQGDAELEGKSVLVSNVPTERANRLLAGLRISLRQKVYSKLDRRKNASPLGSRTMNSRSPTSLSSARKQNLNASLRKDEVKGEAEFISHFNHCSFISFKSHSTYAFTLHLLLFGVLGFWGCLLYTSPSPRD